jgi:DUF4097 and DUF4098 domain-containing protein YvlB
VRVLALVEVHAENDAEAEREFRAVEDGMRAEGKRVRVTAPGSERTTFLFFGRGLKVDYEVTAPFATDVSIDARNGRVEVRDVAGSVNIGSRNGRVIVERAGGSVRVEGRNGRLDATDCRSDLKLTGRNGSIYVTRAAGYVAAETYNGDVVVQGTPLGARVRSNNGTLKYSGDVQGDLDIEVEGNGSVRLAVPADSRFALDAEAVRGDVRSDLPVNEQALSAEPRPTVRLRTVNGSIKIEALEVAR